jgi:hypothetical protein
LPAQAFTISLGTTKGLIFRGPVSSSFLLDGEDPADARPDHDAAPALVALGEVDAAVLRGLLGRPHPEVAEAVHPLRLAGIDQTRDVPIADFARKPDRPVVALLERLDGRDAGTALDEALPRVRDVVPQIGDGPHAGDHHPPEFDGSHDRWRETGGGPHRRVRPSPDSSGPRRPHLLFMFALM